MFIFTGRNEVVAKVIFLHLSVIHSVHRGVLPQCMLGYPPGADPPGADTPPPRSRHPPTAEPPPPGSSPPPPPPPPGADSSIRSTSGRYASYWNAFLFVVYYLSIDCEFMAASCHNRLKINDLPSNESKFHVPLCCVVGGV